MFNFFGHVLYKSNGIHVAAYQQRYDDLVAAYNYNPNQLNDRNNHGKTPFDDALSPGRRSENYQNIINFLLEKGALRSDEVHALLNYQATPLHHAAYWGDYSRLLQLLPANNNQSPYRSHNINNKNHRGITALDDAMNPNAAAPRDNQQNIINLLRANGARTAIELDNNAPPIVAPLPVPQLHDVWQLDKNFITEGNELGRSAFGIVYAGRWKNHIDIAIKKPTQQIGAAQMNMFNHEAQTLAALVNPYIVQFYGVYLNGQQPVIVMELMQGGSLYGLLYRPNQAIDWPLRQQIGLDIAKGIQFLHNRAPSIIHRDLKSPNILLDHHNRAKIADFGIATVKDVAQTVAGSLPWMAPEITPNQDYDKRIDIYSFAIVLLEIASRVFPVRQNGNQIKFVAAMDAGERQMLFNNAEAINCPAFFKQIIEACWDNTPDHRIDINAVVDRFNANMAPSPPPASAPQLTN